MKENRIVHEVVVPHSPAPELTICYERFSNDGFRVWIKGLPRTWEIASTLEAGIGRLMMNLATDEDGISVEKAEYHKDKGFRVREKRNS